MLPAQDVEESLYGGVGLHVPLGTRPQVAWERSEPSVGEEVKGEGNCVNAPRTYI